MLDASGTAQLTNTYTATTTFTLVGITSSGTPSCPQVVGGTAIITVVQLPVASISVSGSTTVCTGNTALIVFTGTPGAIVTYTANGVTTTVTISEGGSTIITPSLTGTTTYTLVSATTAGSPGCSQPQTGSIVITVNPGPQAGNDVANVNFCANSPAQDLFLLLGPTAQAGGTWSPALTSGTGIFNPAVDLPGTYVYTITGSAPCPGDSASVTVSIVPPANAGNDNVLSVCSNEDPHDLFLLLGPDAQTGGTWSPVLSSGTGVFNPAVDPAGNYTYTLAGSATCGSDSAVVTVTVIQGPDAGQDGAVTFCINSTPQDLFLSLNGTPQTGGTWSPALASGSGLFNPAVDAAGVYTYTFIGNQPCDNDTATVTVTVNPIPDAGESSSVIFCSNFAPADLILNLQGTPQPGGTWSPALASGSGVFNPLVDAPGVYTYTVGGGLCTTDTATVTVSVVQSPNAGGGSTLQTCMNVTSLNLTTGLNGTQGAGVWTDNDASGALAGDIFNPSAVVPGTYHFTYTVSGGESPCTTDTAVVTVIVSPQPNAGTFFGIQNVCASQGTFDLLTLLNGPQAGGIFTDTNGAPITNPLNIATLAAGTYSFIYTVTNACGTDTETIQLNINANPVITQSDIIVSSPICIGQDVTVSLTDMADGSYTVNYSLSGSNVVASQTILLTVTSGSTSFTIPGTSLVNIGSTTLTFNSILNNNTSCSNVLTNAAVTFTVTPLPTFAGATLVANDACFGTDVAVSISTAANIPDGDYNFGYVIPELTPGTGESGIITITNGAGTFTIPSSVFGPSGEYSILLNSIMSISGCDNGNTTTVPADFTILALPDTGGATVTAADACLGLPNQINITGAIGLPDGNYDISYQLSGASAAFGTITTVFTGGSASFEIPETDLPTAGSVTVLITNIVADVTACGNSDNAFSPVTFTVIQLTTPTLVAQGNEFCDTDNPAIANLSANIEGEEVVVWYNAPTDGTAYAPTDLLQNGVTYYATFVTDSGCESPVRLAVTVNLTVCDDLVIPDGFSPNGDGINDEFVINHLPETYPNFKLEIYNRYGNILYKGKIDTPNWNGTDSEGGLKVGDGVVPVGVYFYILEFNDGTRKPVQGRVYLSR
jgi:gliding motility-associated-like protein